MRQHRDLGPRLTLGLSWLRELLRRLVELRHRLDELRRLRLLVGPWLRHTQVQVRPFTS